MLINDPHRPKVTLTIHDYPEEVTSFLSGVEEISRLKTEIETLKQRLKYEDNQLRTEIERLKAEVKMYKGNASENGDKR